MKRRDFLTAAAAAGTAGCAPAREDTTPPSQWISEDAARGHRLREEDAGRAPRQALSTSVLIVGGGIGGLSAAWWLDRRGIDDYLLCELRDEAGGNARAGKNAISEFPLAAHYLPLPTRESVTLRELLAELGVIEEGAHSERPRFAEQLLCAAPQERLYIHGHWQDGLVPDAGIAPWERAQIRRFREMMAALSAPRDGIKPFALPAFLGRADVDLLALDRLSMRDWMLAQGLNSPALHWYVDYACRDDYGTRAAQTSAWAGVHYFASRDGRGEDTASDEVLTAPGGNAWIARGLAGARGSRLQCGRLVRSLAADRSGWLARIEAPDGSVTEVRAQSVIWAAPLFIVPRVIAGLPALARTHAAALQYAPWVLAQLSLRSAPAERTGAPISWDNVRYGSESLGYVVATHQSLRLRPAPSVWTWFHALGDGDAREQRRALLAASSGEWARRALQDLKAMYPDIGEHVERIDCVRHGHAMVRPLPGFLTAPGRTWYARGMPDLQFAHADVSGFSLCEEAHARGVRAAERIARRLRGAGAGSDLVRDGGALP